MADRGSYPSGARIDFRQMQMEAQYRWLRPAEISEILCNYQKFDISSEPPNRPSSGSLFLFDRKVLRYFRKDGHNWRKKKDGKTVKEAHEKLKVGSVDVLHCYYAHGEENENFQRRCYWLLEQDMMHIVFVHYLEVKGNKMNVGGLSESNEVISNLGKASPLTYSYPENHSKAPSGITDSTSPTSTLTSSCEEADSGDSYQVSSRFSKHLHSPQMGHAPTMDKMNFGPLNSYIALPKTDSHEGQSSIPIDQLPRVLGDRPKDNLDGTYTIESQRTLGLGSWEEVLEQCSRGLDSVPSNAGTGINLQKDNLIHGELLSGQNSVKTEYLSSVPVQSNSQIPLADDSLHLSNWNLCSNLDLAYDPDVGLFEGNEACLQNALEAFHGHVDQQCELPIQNNLLLGDLESQCLSKSSYENEMHREHSINHAFSIKQKLLNGEGGLEKVDSFTRWANKELGEVEDLNMQSSSGISWTSVGCENVVEDSSLSLSLAQDQLFSITDFSPKWSYTDLEIEVLVIGTFLKSQQEVAKCNWSCMFGEVEVPAEILADGVLCCRAPPHTVGQVPFYVTCSNRQACSEVREFEFKMGSVKDLVISDVYGCATGEMILCLRLEKLLSTRSLSLPNYLSEKSCEKLNIMGKIIFLKEEEEQMVEPTTRNLSQHGMKEQVLQKQMKEKLYSWLLRKVIEDGKGPSVLDDEGQGVLHLSSALGYDWAIKPTITAGVSINFRDVNGWTSLHWAAFCGREQTVAVLVSMGAASGALTDPTPEFPLCRTPADLASANGHKGISGFLAESSLTSHLSSLTVNDSTENGASEDSRARAVQTVSERTPTSVNYGDGSDALSLKDSLTAVCNATQAADRIHQVFRMQSFQRKQLTEFGNNFDISDEHALSLVTTKTLRPVHSGQAHAAAIQIQKKFRGWKKRKEFLLIRQRIVKIQAHVRGHQVRKQYKSITWSVGILEKVILRWRRRRSGLRGFRRDALSKQSEPQSESLEDGYDFLKEGRKQTEERLQKALSRVKSMVQYPEGRAQYRRLLTVVEGFRAAKEGCDMDLSGSEEMIDDIDEDLVGIDSLVYDDTLMPIASD